MLKAVTRFVPLAITIIFVILGFINLSQAGIEASSSYTQNQADHFLQKSAIVYRDIQSQELIYSAAQLSGNLWYMKTYDSIENQLPQAEVALSVSVSTNVEAQDVGMLISAITGFHVWVDLNRNDTAAQTRRNIGIGIVKAQAVGRSFSRINMDANRIRNLEIRHSSMALKWSALVRGLIAWGLIAFAAVIGVHAFFPIPEPPDFPRRTS